MSETHVVAREVVSESGKTKILCEFCCVSFASRKGLYRHLRAFHQLDVVKPGNQACGICFEKLRTISLLHEHLQKKHSISLNFTDETFYLEKDFQDWKSEIEKESISSFILRTTKKKSSIIHSYYVCHRSGVREFKKNRVRSTRVSGSIKTGVTCPAFIKVTTQTVDEISEIKVQYQSVHIGHDLEASKLRLTKEERANLAACLKLGISIDKILEQAKQNSAPTSRYQFLTRKHLHNIRREFGISLNIQELQKVSIVQNNKVESSDSSVSFDGFLDAESSNHEEVQEQEEMQEKEKNTAVSSLLLLQNDIYFDELKIRKTQIITQLKELESVIDEWDPACTLPNVEEHIKALRAVLDFAASANRSLQIQGTLPVLSNVTVNKPMTKRKITKVKENPKKKTKKN